jgi:hypothetical protein
MAMTIRYDFDGFKYDYDVPFDIIDKLFEEEMPHIDDWTWWLQFEENEEQFYHEWEDYLKDLCYDEALEEAKEQAMDPYEFYGVSRSMF